MSEAGFEPAHPKILGPKPSALDLTLPSRLYKIFIIFYNLASLGFDPRTFWL